jgi:hypothetical protein
LINNNDNYNIYNENQIICDIIRYYSTEKIDKEMELTVKRCLFDNNDIVNIDDYVFTKKFEYYKYNEALILGYESGLYLLKDNYQSFIDKQQEYLDSLNIINKKAIQDYTKEIVSEDYIKPFNNNTFDIRQARKNIGDAFAFFVCMFIKNFINDDSINNKEILHANYDTIDNFFDNYKNNSLPKYYDEYHPLYKILSNDNWKIIISMYLNNLNELILNAPKLENDLFLYRGANNNYLNEQEIDPDNNPLYHSSRIASYSMNYEASKHFYTGGANPIMFRVLFKTGTRALFITPFADYRLDREMEVLTAKSQILSVYDNIDSSTDAFKNTIEAYNNINNTNCLSLNDRDKINTHPFLYTVPYTIPPPEPPIFSPTNIPDIYNDTIIRQLPYHFDTNEEINALIKYQRFDWDLPPAPPPVHS